MRVRGTTGVIAVLLIALAIGLSIGCGSDAEELGFSGTWVSTGGSELTLKIGAANDGAYPVTFAGGDVERTLSATKTDEDTYRAEGDTDVWVFRLVDDSLMTVTVIPAEGAEATTSFKRHIGSYTAAASGLHLGPLRVADATKGRDPLMRL